MCYSFIRNVKLSFHTASGQSSYFEFLFYFSFVILISKMKSLFLNLSASPSVTNLSIDSGGNDKLVYNLKNPR